MRRARRGRRRPKIVIPVASMADVAFQLIIFFMICSNFAREAGIPVAPPSAPRLDRLRQSTTVVSVDAQGQVYVQGRRVPDPAAAEAELAALLRNAHTPEARTVLFRCDRKVGREVFEPVLDAVTRAGGIVAAIGEQSEDGATDRESRESTPISEATVPEEKRDGK